MANLQISATSNWGKTVIGHWLTEINLRGSEYRHAVIFDHKKSEWAGFDKNDGRPDSLRFNGFSAEKAPSAPPSAWAKMITRNRRLRISRGSLPEDQWRAVVSNVSTGIRGLDSTVLAVVDEAHKVAGQSMKVPDPIVSLATMGDGEGTSIFWITQTPSTLHYKVRNVCNARFFGGFPSGTNLDQVTYPEEVHYFDRDPEGEIRGLPPELHHDRLGAVPLRRIRKGGDVVGSEWIYSDSDERKRIHSGGIDMETSHEGGYRPNIKIP